MYYNGYILMSIFIGAFLGFVVFEWEWIECTGIEAPKEEATSCCG
jgi:copper transporter 1